MAITQISQIQVRRGKDQDLPELSPGEFGWSTDKRKLYIGNGVRGTPDYSPIDRGHTEVLTELSIVDFTTGINDLVGNIASNVSVLQGNVVAINANVAILQAALISSNTLTLPFSSSGPIVDIPDSNAIINYTLSQGYAQRSGTITMNYDNHNQVVTYQEEFSETDSTDITFSFSPNVSTSVSTLNYSTVTQTFLRYRLQSL